MTITATFSTGHIDTYKGSRPVKAAWAIIRIADGKVLKSGHSLDRAKAEKTAHNNAGGAFIGLAPIALPRVKTVYARQAEYHIARSIGWDGKGNPRKFVEAENARRATERAKLYRVEVVSL